MRYADLTRQQRQPDQALRSLSRALDEMPNVELDSIEWKIGRNSASTAASITGDEEITVIRGTIRPGKNTSTRQILASFEAFAERLRRDPGSSVSALQQPFDLESGRSLRGGDGSEEISQPRQFALEISRKIAP
jgi:hypothetical protein